MSTEQTRPNNMLSCGYLREYENDNNVIIPNAIQSVVAMYCSIYSVYGIGSDIIPTDTSSQYSISPVNKLISNPNDLVANGYGTNIKHRLNELYITSNNLNSDFNLINISFPSISVMSSGISNNTVLYIYTVNGDLHKSDINLKTEITYNKIYTSFLNNNDTIIDIKCGSNHTLFLTKFGNLYTYGCNDIGACGFDQYKYPEIDTPTLAINNLNHKIISIACGAFHSVALNSHNQLICFGYNCVGQLGINCSSEIRSGLSSVVDHDVIAENVDEKVNRALFSFIDSSDDESEETNTMCIDKPIINNYFNDLNIKIIKIYCGKHHSLCISNNGKAFTFGINTYGNLGNGKATGYGVSNSIPYEISKEFGFIIDGSCGENHNLLLNKNNKIICFGNNSRKQCTKMNKIKVMTPLFVSKRKELGLNHNSFIEKVTCLKNESLIFVDVYRRS
eukprot:135777_1